MKKEVQLNKTKWLAEADFFDGRWIPKRFHTLCYLTGSKYGLMTRTIEAQGKE